MLLTEKPSINLSANKIISALIISKNKPNVTIVIGKVKITKMGFTNRFNTDKTTATIIAVIYVSTCTPVKKYAITNTAIAFNRSLIISFIFNIFYINFQKNSRMINELI